jgi:hypothetical protein
MRLRARQSLREDDAFELDSVSRSSTAESDVQ